MIKNNDFEIPDYYTIATDKEILNSLSLAEYNIYINLDKHKAKLYKINCIIRHFKDKSLTPKVDSEFCFFDKVSNCIICKEGFTFDKSKCVFVRL